jgi:Flp pilus assembly pilin Flp
MRFLLARRTPGAIEFGIIYGLIAVLMLTAARFLPLLTLAPSCVFKALTGLPCPTCGSTRSITHLSHGDFSSAFVMNPLMVVAVGAALLSLLYGFITLLFGLPRIAVKMSEREKDILRLSSGIILVSNWVYLAVTL